jgi:cellobiose transport system permease protein
MSALTAKKPTLLTVKPKFSIGSALSYLVLGVTTFLVVFPFWWMLVVASNEKNEIAKNPPRFTLGDQLPVTFDVIFQYANISHHRNFDGSLAYVLLHLCRICICKVEI